MAKEAMPSFVNIRVIIALMMREMSTRYGRSAGGYIWAILEPVGAILILSIVFSAAIRTPSIGTSFPLFFATGYLPFQFYSELSAFSAAAITMNKSLLTYPRVTPIDAILARFFLQFFTISTSSIIIFSGIVVVEDIHTIYDYVALLKAVGYASLLGLGVGTTNTVIFAFVPTYRNVWKIVTRPMFLISGVFFLYEDMPRTVQDILWYNPVLHVVGLMRRGFYPTYHATYVSEFYVGGLGILFLTIGFFLVYSNKTYLIEAQ
ncbi:ABC transporter permease [Pikeienuella sp. HZG-20]|uniref:ABC transporter permease n=1 Tax=Paludibacillus litoralis TaxID=3133267 RepID=UPI0030EC5821